MSQVAPLPVLMRLSHPHNVFDHQESGHIELIIGPMFSGKTTELIRRLKRYRIAQYACLIIKYSGDSRYESNGVATHDRQILPAISTDKLHPIRNTALAYDVIGIDEGQFAFGDILNLIPLAESVTKLTAVCTICFKPAAFTRRKTQENEVEVIGGNDKYLAVCRDCFTAPLPPTPERNVLQEFNTPIKEEAMLERRRTQRQLFGKVLS